MALRCASPFRSNMLPWRESCAKVVTIAEDATGRLCRRSLAEALAAYRDAPLVIGAQTLHTSPR